jgi:hypothetical protein
MESTLFWQVTSGMEVAEKISWLETDTAEWPLIDIYIKMTFWNRHNKTKGLNKLQNLIGSDYTWK